MVKELYKNEGFLFAFKSLVAYLMWVLLKMCFTKIGFLLPVWRSLNDALAEIYIKLSAWVLEVMSYQLKYNPRNLFVEGTEGLYVGDHCLGLSASFVFFFIILLLKGRWQVKIPYVLFGLLIIFCINWFRVIGLALMLVHGSKAFFHFNHSYTYLVMVYGVIFLMIVYFEKKFSK